jgi:hypothetical protein
MGFPQALTPDNALQLRVPTKAEKKRYNFLAVLLTNFINLVMLQCVF